MNTRIQDFSSTNDEPTIDMTVDELVERFQKVKGHWDEESFSNYAAAVLGQVADEEDDGQYIIAVEAIIQYSGERMTGMLPARVIGIFGEDAMPGQTLLSKASAGSEKFRTKPKRSIPSAHGPHKG